MKRKFYISFVLLIVCFLQIVKSSDDNLITSETEGFHSITSEHEPLPLITSEILFVKKEGFEEVVNFFTDGMDSEIEELLTKKTQIPSGTVFPKFENKNGVKYFNGGSSSSYTIINSFALKCDLWKRIGGFNYHTKKPVEITLIGLNKLRVLPSLILTLMNNRLSTELNLKMIKDESKREKARRQITICRTGLVKSGNNFFILTRIVWGNSELQSFWLYRVPKPAFSYLLWKNRYSWSFMKDRMKINYYEFWINVGYDRFYGIMLPNSFQKEVECHYGDPKRYSMDLRKPTHQSTNPREPFYGSTKLRILDMQFMEIDTNVLHGTIQSEMCLTEKCRILKLLAQDLLLKDYEQFEKKVKDEFKKWKGSKETFYAYAVSLDIFADYLRTLINDSPLDEFKRRYPNVEYDENHFKNYIDVNIKNKDNVEISAADEYGFIHVLEQDNSVLKIDDGLMEYGLGDYDVNPNEINDAYDDLDESYIDVGEYNDFDNTGGQFYDNSW